MTFQESFDLFIAEHPDDLMSEILNKIDAFVCIIDIQDGKIIWANRYFIHKMGYSAAVLMNLTSDELLWLVHPDYRELFVASLISANDESNDNPFGLFKIRMRRNNWTWVLFTCISYEKNILGKICKLLAFATEVDICQLNTQISNISSSEKTCNASGLIKLLSEREKKVIELIADGNTDRRISEYLGISIHTAKTHRKRIIRKMGLRNSGALIKYALENGLA
jgi:DNA-binding CsgD family transcriptional regulator